MLDIIIVNWNAGLLLRNCLLSIASAGKEDFEINRVIVVDNASQDGSADNLDDIPLPIQILKNKHNIGFAAACNLGAQDSEADYLLFLNPDTELFRDSLSIPIAFMESEGNRKMGICGIQLVDDRGEVTITCARFPTPTMFFYKMLGLDIFFPNLFSSHFMNDWDHSETKEVDQVMGAFFLVRKGLFDELNGFDTRFFLYFEEVDFTYRASKKNWRTIYLADVRSYHRGLGTTDNIVPLRLFYSLRSRILYGYKHFGIYNATLLMLGTLFLEPITRLLLSAFRRSWIQAWETVQGYGMLYRSTPEIIRVIKSNESSSS